MHLLSVLAALASAIFSTALAEVDTRVCPSHLPFAFEFESSICRCYPSQSEGQQLGGRYCGGPTSFPLVVMMLLRLHFVYRRPSRRQRKGRMHLLRRERQMDRLYLQLHM
jgi:hypothetical protein